MGELDLGAVRAFVAVVDTGNFGDAAAELDISQQAVSKRVAKLESAVGAALLSRSRSGATATRDGAVLLSHARNLLAAADRTVGALRSSPKPLRVDVLDTRLASIDLVRAFYRTTRGLELDIVTSLGLRSARKTLKAGTVDAAFARVVGPLTDGVVSTCAYLEPLQLLVGAAHPLAGRPTVAMAELSGLTAWMPGNVRGSEWADFYDSLGGEFSIQIDTSGPDFGYEAFVRRFSESPKVFGFVGDLTRVPHHPEVVRIPIEHPRPCYLWSLLWHESREHPALPRLVKYVRRGYQPPSPIEVWLPLSDWARADGS